MAALPATTPGLQAAVITWSVNVTPRVFAGALIVFLLSVSPIRIGAREESSIPRSLVHLRLGESLKKVQMIYKPAQEWPSYMEPMGHVNRIRVERPYLRMPVPNVETMWLGFKRGGLVEVQLIYDAAYTRGKSAEALAVEWSRIYGEPQRDEEGRYWWADGSTVLSVFETEVRVLAGKGHVVERRTSVRLMERGSFESVD